MPRGWTRALQTIQIQPRLPRIQGKRRMRILKIPLKIHKRLKMVPNQKWLVVSKRRT